MLSKVESSTIFFLVFGKTQPGIEPRRINADIWMHHVDANEAYGEKAWRKLRKNATSCIEPVLGAPPHKIATVRPPNTHHENHQKLFEPNMRDTAGEVGVNT